jgi:hypothetical protein
LRAIEGLNVRFGFRLGGIVTNVDIQLIAFQQLWQRLAQPFGTIESNDYDE